jgi:hypothetical protein
MFPLCEGEIMRPIMGYYCWVKQVSLADANEPDGSNSAGGRPPTPLAGSLAATAVRLTGTAGDLNDTDFKARSAIPLMYMGWSLDLMFPGDATKGATKYTGGFANREDALDFLTDARTKSWFSNAKDFFLMRFDFLAPLAFDPDNPAVPVTHIESGTNHPPYKGNWEAGFKAEAYRSAQFLGRSWTGIDLSGALKPKEEECSVFRDTLPKWQEGDNAMLARRENISAAHAALTLFEAIEQPDPYRAKLYDAIKFVTFMVEETIPPLSHFKQMYNVERPNKACGVNILRRLRVPEHASFPSGHATQAWLVALALSPHLPPDKAGKLKEAAQNISDRRVMAGLHYPMDAEGGKLLAQKLLDLLLKNTDFIELRDAAVSQLTGTPLTRERQGAATKSRSVSATKKRSAATKKRR